MVFAEPELFANRFLDGRSAQHFPCSRTLLSQLLTRIKLVLAGVGLNYFEVHELFGCCTSS
jgi:hypothetical protein